MKKATLISVRVPDELAERLDSLAKATERSRSFLATRAIEEYVGNQEWQVAAIKDGMEDALAGRVVSHEKALEELDKWGEQDAH